MSGGGLRLTSTLQVHAGSAARTAGIGRSCLDRMFSLLLPANRENRSKPTPNRSP